MEGIFDIIVVGGGHAGVEAAHASARMGLRVLLLTHSIKSIGALSCNPSIGGIGKGHLVKEIDALGGLMGRAADQAGIQFRRLNLSKGAAVRATRVQVDSSIYRQVILQFLKAQSSLTIKEAAVDELLIKILDGKEKVCGVVTDSGAKIKAKAVVVTPGTFLSGKIHIGLESFSGGRVGEPAAVKLANFLKGLGLRAGRLKTGTPPRLEATSIDYSKLVEQVSDKPLPIFSFAQPNITYLAQRSCFITQTNEITHAIIRKSLDRSPLFTGVIVGTGPRYCPSIEDKIHRFADRDSHQIFLEPEGLDGVTIYPSGVSTSVPGDVQQAFINSIQGLEQAVIVKLGYAIEYDFFDPRDLKPSLESKKISNLFFAGQVNGTTGYEEAAAQGILAGINASLTLQKRDIWYPKRGDAYLGVMLDDLLIKGTLEPYRMFTSRAEYRLLLREDNADLRLTEIGYRLGVVSELQYKMFSNKRDMLYEEKARLEKIFILPQTSAGNAIANLTDRPYEDRKSVLELLRQKELSYAKLITAGVFTRKAAVTTEIAEQIEIQIKYHGYIERQLQEINRQRKHDELTIPEYFDYGRVRGLAKEVLERLRESCPKTVGQASRVPGVTPAAISLLLIHLKKKM